ncbi:43390_t:CDS:2 [Gigaspora margarita]|uniref:43390_t:CDS:1 n=1 Tax=Gigaspora margarita TaxID=4874 RepID=A0ABN7V2V6_GIGMA|nr:43390_t:CDS:2 [Gigaspora margarita]
MQTLQEPGEQSQVKNRLKDTLTSGSNMLLDETEFIETMKILGSVETDINENMYKQSRSPDAASIKDLMSSHNEKEFQKKEVLKRDETYDKQTDTPANLQDALAAVSDPYYSDTGMEITPILENKIINSVEMFQNDRDEQTENHVISQSHMELEKTEHKTS